MFFVISCLFNLLARSILDPIILNIFHLAINCQIRLEEMLEDLLPWGCIEARASEIGPRPFKVGSGGNGRCDGVLRNLCSGVGSTGILAQFMSGSSFSESFTCEH